MVQREGAPTLKRGDAHVVSIQSDLLKRTVSMQCDVEHLREFHRLPEGFQFILELEAVQSARVFKYSIWPGKFSVPTGVSRHEESRLVLEYQPKWREESLAWTDFERAVTRECEQVLDIADAVLATLGDSVALRLRGHLNYTVYHEVYLRADKLTVSGTNGKIFGLKEFQDLGDAYWEAFRHRPEQS